MECGTTIDSVKKLMKKHEQQNVWNGNDNINMRSLLCFNAQGLNKYIDDKNKITQIIVYLTDETIRSYSISWTSKFEDIHETESIMLFECKKEL